MKLMRIGPPHKEHPVLFMGEGQCFDLRRVTNDITAEFLADDGIEKVRRAHSNGDLAPIDISGERVGSPIARPGVVVCIGMNYAAHAAESNSEPPEFPVLFYKAPNTVVGPHDNLPLPPGSTKTDWEVELAVVIGRRLRYLDSPREALQHVAGYAISNDVSERHLQLEVSGGQWSKGKSCEGFNPFGPWIVTSDEIPNPQGLRLLSRVNGEPRQDSNTRDMIFGVAELLFQLSQVMVLEPGDIVNTGTPEGVALSGRFPYLATGDVVEVEVEGLGQQRQTVVNAPRYEA